MLPPDEIAVRDVERLIGTAGSVAIHAIALASSAASVH
jgi:hypothetical protein